MNACHSRIASFDRSFSGPSTRVKEQSTGNYKGLAETAIPFTQRVQSLLEKLGPPTHGMSWFVSLRFKRPIEPWRTLGPRVEQDVVLANAERGAKRRGTGRAAKQFGQATRAQRQWSVAEGIPLPVKRDPQIHDDARAALPRQQPASVLWNRLGPWVARRWLPRTKR